MFSIIPSGVVEEIREMQVGIGGNCNESNTFCSTTTEMVAFGVKRADEIHSAARVIEQKPGVLAAGVAAGFQYAEVYEMRPIVAVLKDKYSDLAGYGARCLSIRLWAARDQPSMDLPEATEASRQARESDHIRVLLVEIGENISSSSAGDSASILKQLLQLKVESWLVASADPEAAQVHKHVNIGVLVCLLMAEKTEDLHGTPAIGPWVDQMPTRWKLH